MLYMPCSVFGEPHLIRGVFEPALMTTVYERTVDTIQLRADEPPNRFSPEIEWFVGPLWVGDGVMLARSGILRRARLEPFCQTVDLCRFACRPPSQSTSERDVIA